ncbi:hypothetical protein P4V29_33890 [Bacillus thuringiensis]|nr:hypothetical protein [Bacillus thuringiensis]MED1757277.1 hypothetical protein [Bacillus thuringiensis]
MTLRKIFLGGLILLFAFSAYFLFTINSEKGKNKTSNAALAATKEETDETGPSYTVISDTVHEDVLQEEAQKYVPFKLIIPEAPKELNKPKINVVLPPPEAVTELAKTKRLTRIEIFYDSTKNENEGIVVVQTNHEIVQLNEVGEEEKLQKVKIANKEVNTYDCNCESKVKKYVWFDGQVTTEITVYGDINQESINQIVSNLPSSTELISESE